MYIDLWQEVVFVFRVKIKLVYVLDVYCCMCLIYFCVIIGEGDYFEILVFDWYSLVLSCNVFKKIGIFQFVILM